MERVVICAFRNCVTDEQGLLSQIDECREFAARAAWTSFERLR